MLKGKTKSGFEFEVKDDALDDWELLEALTKIDRGEFSYFIDAAKMLLGEEQLSRLKEHSRNENGRISVERMSIEIQEIFESGNDTKNS